MSGVPQDARPIVVLISYIMYINDLIERRISSRMFLYADDSKIFRINSDVNKDMGERPRTKHMSSRPMTQSISKAKNLSSRR
jgi:hypothetical protein